MELYGQEPEQAKQLFLYKSIRTMLHTKTVHSNYDTCMALFQKATMEGIFTRDGEANLHLTMIITIISLYHIFHTSSIASNKMEIYTLINVLFL